MIDDVGMPECRMCGRRGVAGHYSVVKDIEGTQVKLSEYVCDKCWNVLKKGGTKGHVFKATGEHWWLAQCLEHLKSEGL